MNINRRDAIKTLALGSAALAAASWTTRAESETAPQFALPPLPYGFDALEPHLDARTMEIHHDRHHKAYVDGLNAAISGHPELATQTVEQLVAHLSQLPESVRTAVRNHGGGHANHSLFWKCLSPAGGGVPTGALADAIESMFAGFDAMKDQMITAGKGVFGSGWVWLCLASDRRLLLTTTPNQDSPLTAGHTPLLGLDVWEHAYYLHYQNRRADYLQAIFNVVDWEFVGARYVEEMDRA